MLKEVEANRTAWGLLSRDHYERFKKLLQENKSILSSIVESELGDVSGKKIIHLPCNTGADTVSLARKGAYVTGVDLVPENIFYAKKMAQELNVENIDFIESDIMELMDKHNTQYDMAFTTEGALHWMPDLDRYAQTIKHLLKDNGVLYLLDSHPFYFAMDEGKLKENKLEIMYPYFVREPEYNEYIGGYASEPKKGINYGWMYTISDIINPLAKAGFTIEFFNEHDRLCFDLGGMKKDEQGNWHYPFFDKKLPFMFSLKARLNK